MRDGIGHQRASLDGRVVFRLEIPHLLLARGVDHDHPAAAADMIAMPLEKSDLPRELLRARPVVIVIQDGDVLAARARQSEIGCLRDVANLGTPEVLNPAIALHPVLHDHRNFFIRSVVHDQQFPVGNALREDALDRNADEVRPVERQHQHADSWRH